MKRAIVQIFFFFASFPLWAQYIVVGGNGSPLVAENKNRIAVYLLNGLTGAEISYTSSEEEAHQWYRYDKKTIDAVPIPCSQSGKTSTITGIEDGYGYFVTPSSGLPYYAWIIDYSKYLPVIPSIRIDDDSDDRCEYLKIMADVIAKPLEYYSEDGNKISLQRKYHLSYNTLEWNEDSKMFLDKPVDLEISGIVEEIIVESPLKNTSFTLSGDDFAKHFGLTKTVTIPVYEAIAVKAIGIPEQFKTPAENEQTVAGSDLGGSAPVNIIFTAYANEPVATFFIWTIDQVDPVTGNLNTIVRYTDKVLQYNFEETGRFFVKLHVIDSKSVCEDTTQVFTVNIGETDLQVPNFFSPGSSIGSNDEFRVLYKSIVSFKCSIFNRWGNLLYQWNDPAKGWDGRVAGKYVPTGAYFYVIEYKGADGKKKTKSGNVNILRSKN